MIIMSRESQDDPVRKWWMTWWVKLLMDGLLDGLLGGLLDLDGLLYSYFEGLQHLPNIFFRNW